MSASEAVFPLCRHIKTNGHRCKSPAMRGTALCFFHRNIHRTHRRPQTAESLMSTWQESSLEGFRLGGEDPLTIARAYPRQNEIHFPALEDAESVQLATSMLFQAIATGSVHFRRAKLLMQTLKIATLNIRAVTTAARFIPDDGPIPTHVVRTAHGHLLAADDDDQHPTPGEVEEELAPDDDQELPGEPIDEPEPEDEEPVRHSWCGPAIGDNDDSASSRPVLQSKVEEPGSPASLLAGVKEPIPSLSKEPAVPPVESTEPAPEYDPECDPTMLKDRNSNSVNYLEPTDDPTIIYIRQHHINR